MKKFILTAVAAGALAVGGAASAQDLGAVFNSIFGIGQPTYNYGYGGSTPAVVAGTTPYYGQQPYYGSTTTNQIYADQYGRQFYYDQYGRQVFIQSQSNVYGNNVYGNVQQYDQWGRPIYGTYSSNYGYRSWDRDGDGVANRQDRWPDDSRYW